MVVSPIGSECHSSTIGPRKDYRICTGLTREIPRLAAKTQDGMQGLARAWLRAKMEVA
jgi:hypothetical protein